MLYEELTKKINGYAMKVHKRLGNGAIKKNQDHPKIRYNHGSDIFGEQTEEIINELNEVLAA